MPASASQFPSSAIGRVLVYYLVGQASIIGQIPEETTQREELFILTLSSWGFSIHQLALLCPP